MKRITSRDNPRFKWWRQLAHSGRARRKMGKTVLDGAHLLQAYLDRVGVPGALAVSDQGLLGPEIRELLDRCAGADVTHFTDPLFGAISPVDTPTGLVSAIEIPASPAAADIKGSCVVLDGVQDAGNAGSILRSAAAAGIEWVVLNSGCAQVWSPKVLRSAMGAHFVLQLIETADSRSVLQTYKGKTIATLPEAEADLFDLDLTGPVAWLFGSEGGGISRELIESATDLAKIPMASASESLNVAAAAAVCLFEQLRQRSKGSQPSLGAGD